MKLTIKNQKKKKWCRETAA